MFTSQQNLAPNLYTCDYLDFVITWILLKGNTTEMFLSVCFHCLQCSNKCSPRLLDPDELMLFWLSLGDLLRLLGATNSLLSLLITSAGSSASPYTKTQVRIAFVSYLYLQRLTLSLRTCAAPWPSSRGIGLTSGWHTKCV